MKNKSSGRQLLRQALRRQKKQQKAQKPRGVSIYQDGYIMSSEECRQSQALLEAEEAKEAEIEAFEAALIDRAVQLLDPYGQTTFRRLYNSAPISVQSEIIKALIVEALTSS